MTIKGYVSSLGIIKCFRSIKKIIIKHMLKIKNRSVVNEIPNKQNIKTKLSPEINSTKKYFTFILVEHSMHRALRIIKDNRGMLLYHLICLLHEGQKDLPFTTLIFLGILWMQTLLKLPHILPKINTIIQDTIYSLIWEENSMSPSMQYCINNIASAMCKQKFGA